MRGRDPACHLAWKDLHTLSTLCSLVEERSSLGSWSPGIVFQLSPKESTAEVPHHESVTKILASQEWGRQAKGGRATRPLNNVRCDHVMVHIPNATATNDMAAQSRRDQRSLRELNFKKFSIAPVGQPNRQ